MHAAEELNYKSGRFLHLQMTWFYSHGVPSPTSDRHRPPQLPGSRDKRAHLLTLAMVPSRRPNYATFEKLTQKAQTFPRALRPSEAKVAWVVSTATPHLSYFVAVTRLCELLIVGAYQSLEFAHAHKAYEIGASRCVEQNICDKGASVSAVHQVYEVVRYVLFSRCPGKRSSAF